MALVAYVVSVAMTETDPDDETETTQIYVTKAQRRRLNDMMRPEDRYRDVVQRLLDSHETGRQSN